MSLFQDPAWNSHESKAECDWAGFVWDWGCSRESCRKTEVVVERVVERLRLPSCRKTNRATAAAARPKQAPGLSASPSHTGWDTGSSDINRLAINHYLKEPSLSTYSNRIVAYHTIWFKICHIKGYSSALIKERFEELLSNWNYSTNHWHIWTFSSRVSSGCLLI